MRQYLLVVVLLLAAGCRTLGAWTVEVLTGADMALHEDPVRPPDFPLPPPSGGHLVSATTIEDLDGFDYDVLHYSDGRSLDAIVAEYQPALERRADVASDSTPADGQPRTVLSTTVGPVTHIVQVTDTGKERLINLVVRTAR